MSTRGSAKGCKFLIEGVNVMPRELQEERGVISKLYVEKFRVIQHLNAMNFRG